MKLLTSSFIISFLCFLLISFSVPALAQEPFLNEQQWVALRTESNGALPYENLRFLTTLHRVPATPQFHEAAKFMEQKAREYGLSDVRSEQFPIDGKKTYGLMRSYFAWNVEEGRLAELGGNERVIGDWSKEPIRLADYSRSADVTTTLIDVGQGTSESDYAGKDVKGKIVLADGFLSGVERLAVTKFGAAGIVSDMPNQSTAWSGLDPTLVRWGHLDARQPNGFAFMVSRAEAQQLRDALKQGDVRLHAKVKATVGPGHWTVVTGTIPGTDPNAGEIIYSCHLDHERPGANDNGSGCVTILESARILAHLISTGALPKPKRTLRFMWGPEVEGTMAYLATHPEIRKRLRANIHMDMVGGDPFKNKSIFHVTATPWSLPSFVTDVGAAMMERIKRDADTYASSGAGEEAAVVETRAGNAGTRNEFIADVTPYSAGSDHDDFDSSTIAVPSLYLRDWPDIYIHTDHDSLDKIDPTKLRRVALIGAASGYAMGTMDGADVRRLELWLDTAVERGSLEVTQRAFKMAGANVFQPAAYDAANLVRQSDIKDQGILHSLYQFVGSYSDQVIGQPLERLSRNKRMPSPPWASDPVAQRVPVRVGEFGPLTYQNDDVLAARLGPERVKKIKLLRAAVSPQMQSEDMSELYAYEIVNFVDGNRSVGEIRDAVSAEYGPIGVDIVADYLDACVEAGVMRWK